MKTINIRRFFMAAAAVFVTFGFVYVGAGNVFADPFNSITAALNGRETEHMVVWVGRILFSLVFCYIFLQGREGEGIGEGARYGLLIGLLLVGLDIDWFGTSDIVFSDAVIWWASDLVAMVAGGVVLARIYRPVVAPPDA